MNPKLKVTLIIIAIIGAIFWIDDRQHLASRDPLGMSKDFAYGLMTHKRAWLMQSGNKKLNQKMAASLLSDNDYKQICNEIIKADLNKSNIFYELMKEEYLNPRYDNLELISYIKLAQYDDYWDTGAIVLTYSYGTKDFDDNPRTFFYTIALQPKDRETLWEKFRNTIHGIPVVGEKFGYTIGKPEWSVASFYTKDNYIGFVAEQVKKIDGYDKLTGQEKTAHDNRISKLESVDLSKTIETSHVKYLAEKNEEAKRIVTNDPQGSN